jgi:hypothetical protein
MPHGQKHWPWHDYRTHLILQLFLAVICNASKFFDYIKLSMIISHMVLSIYYVRKKKGRGRKIWRETTLEKVGGVREVGGGERQKSMMAAISISFVTSIRADREGCGCLIVSCSTSSGFDHRKFLFICACV